VEAEDCARFGIFQHALLDHQFLPAFLSFGRVFLGGLEDEFDRAGNPIPHLRENLRDAQQNGGMRVMAACVHDAGSCPLYMDFSSDANGRSTASATSSASHISAQGHDRAVLRAPRASQHAGMRHAGLDLQPETLQLFSHQLGGPEFPVGQLRMSMDVGPPGNHLWFHLGGETIDLREERGLSQSLVLRREAACGNQHEKEEVQKMESSVETIPNSCKSVRMRKRYKVNLLCGMVRN